MVQHYSESSLRVQCVCVNALPGHSERISWNSCGFTLFTQERARKLKPRIWRITKTYIVWWVMVEVGNHFGWKRNNMDKVRGVGNDATLSKHCMVGFSYFKDLNGKFQVMKCLENKENFLENENGLIYCSVSQSGWYCSPRGAWTTWVRW